MTHTTQTVAATTQSPGTFFDGCRQKKLNNAIAPLCMVCIVKTPVIQSNNCDITSIMKQGQVNIIGGQWRGRKLLFPAIPDVRPTPSRIRETLFNWLGSALPYADCLDLFAGSGALGFEALSRGAKSVVFIEQSALLVHYLRTQIKQFGISDKARAYHMAFPFSALSMFKAEAPFNTVFLDPPFHHNFIELACAWLAQEPLLSPKSTIYIEMESSLPLPSSLPADWQLRRHKKAGQVRYALLETAA